MPHGAAVHDGIEQRRLLAGMAMMKLGRRLYARPLKPVRLAALQMLFYQAVPVLVFLKIILRSLFPLNSSF